MPHDPIREFGPPTPRQSQTHAAPGTVDSINALHRDYYRSKSITASYAAKKFIFPEEQSFLRDFADEVRGKQMLDLGIGAGRTTHFLLPLASDYIGIDYAETMVGHAKSLFPLAKLYTEDARDLSSFADGQFDFVLFSFNGLDCLGHADRLKCLQEIRRILKKSGLFAFSSHNRDHVCPPPWALSNFHISKHPFRMLRHALAYLEGIRNWARTLYFATEFDDYALRVDSSNCFTTPLYYISKRSQNAQLQQSGFETVRMYDREGELAKVEDFHPHSSWIFYVSRKK